MNWRHGTLLVISTILSAVPASAQDQGRVGVAMGYPASIAAIWQVTDAIAIRPEVGFERTATTYTFTGRTTSLFGTNVGVSGIFYLANNDNLRPYLSPRFAYGHGSGTIGDLGPNADWTTSGYRTSGSVGGQYAFGRRFSAYGEVGIEYLHQTERGNVTLANDLNDVSTRSAVGVIVYF